MAEQFSVSDLRRFWSKVDRSGQCWEWTAARNPAGYGQFRVALLGSKTQMQQAHRVAWVMACSDIPKGLHVCHHCDNPGCVRPEHLFLGTDADNCADMIRKGRKHIAVGAEHPRSKLSEAQVREILAMRRLGIPLREIAAIFGVSNQLVSAIATGIRWKHLSSGAELSSVNLHP